MLHRALQQSRSVRYADKGRVLKDYSGKIPAFRVYEP
jgi:hypothetical protein